LGDSDRVRDSGAPFPQNRPTGIPVSRFIVSGVKSQPIVARLKTLSETYFNTNPDFITSAATTTGDPGVSGGHFDFDIYYGQPCTTSSKFACKKNVHVHEYDDKYDVTGVNMLHPSLAAFNLVNPIPLTTTPFKILLANQVMSPAAKILVGGATGVPVTSYETTAGLTMASLPTYTRSDSSFTLILALPLDAFASKNWIGSAPPRRAGGTRPDGTGCVHDNKGANVGQTGPWMNGALTIQVIKATTGDSAVELNIAGDPTMGYRLKKDATSQLNLLSQYTMFWHHPNGKCVGDAGLGQESAAGLVGSSGSPTRRLPRCGRSEDGHVRQSRRHLGRSDPRAARPAVPRRRSTYTFADGSTVTQTTHENADGSTTVTRVYSNGTIDSYTIPPSSGGKQADARAKTGRVSVARNGPAVMPTCHRRRQQSLTGPLNHEPDTRRTAPP
jgi:hypothetical protein